MKAEALAHGFASGATFGLYDIVYGARTGKLIVENGFGGDYQFLKDYDRSLRTGTLLGGAAAVAAIGWYEGWESALIAIPVGGSAWVVSGFVAAVVTGLMGYHRNKVSR